MKRLNGFTLIEILVALVILAIAFTSFFMSMSVNVRNMQYIQDKTAANWIALNVIAEIQLGTIRFNSQYDNTSGQEKMFTQMWAWEAAIQPTNHPLIYRLDVEVKKINNSQTLIHLIGYLRKKIE